MQQEVLDLIPHRPPFLFIDEILHCDETSVTAQRFVSPEEDFFKGHYPHQPIMPGVLLCEATFQAAAIFLSKQFKEQSIDTDSKTPVVARIKDTKFKNPVLPGDTITIQATWINSVSVFQFFKGVVKNGDKVIMTNEFSVALVPSEKLEAAVAR